MTDIAGTTRDIITETIDLGLPVTLIDTAGIREDKDVSHVEEIGIKYSKQSLKDADLILFVYDSSQGMLPEDKEILKLANGKKTILIANKADIANYQEENVLNISALNGNGIEDLKKIIKSKVCDIQTEDLEFVTNTRQQNCLQKSKQALEQALLGANLHELQDLISIDVKSALLALEELTGELITDDILNNIFDHFCIGK